MTCNPQRLRAMVFERDLGVCKICSCNTESVRLGYEAALAAARERHAAVMREVACIGYRVTLSAEKLNREIRDIRERLERLGFKPGQALFHVHHVQALAEGGRNELANLVTVCTRCHHPLTAETNARLRRKPVKHVLERGEDRQGREVWR